MKTDSHSSAASSADVVSGSIPSSLRHSENTRTAFWYVRAVLALRASATESRKAWKVSRMVGVFIVRGGSLWLPGRSPMRNYACYNGTYHKHKDITASTIGCQV